MQQLLDNLNNLKKAIDNAYGIIGIDSLLKKLDELTIEQSKPDFWNNQNTAKKVNQEISKINTRIEPWQNLKKEVTDNLELASALDESLVNDLSLQYDILQSQYNSLKHDLLFSGEHDNYDAIVSIYAGAGGTDAQDWADMLLRMYLRYCEKNKDNTVEIIDKSDGEEAGIKSVSFMVSGPLIYGKLKSENGVHRLVRLSPFNADSLRQTSFARVEVVPKIDTPEEVIIEDSDLKVDVYRAGGHGGQSVNTTDSAVRVTHIPTGLTVAIQNERSQLQNRETAMTILRSKLAKLQEDQHQENLRELKGPNEQAAWGNQIRNFVLHPYNLVKDLRTNYETSDTQSVLDGNLEQFINAYLELKPNN